MKLNDHSELLKIIDAEFESINEEINYELGLISSWSIATKKYLGKDPPPFIKKDIGFWPDDFIIEVFGEFGSPYHFFVQKQIIEVDKSKYKRLFEVSTIEDIIKFLEEQKDSVNQLLQTYEGYSYLTQRRRQKNQLNTFREILKFSNGRDTSPTLFPGNSYYRPSIIVSNYPFIKVNLDLWFKLESAYLIDLLTSSLIKKISKRHNQPWSEMDLIQCPFTDFENRVFASRLAQNLHHTILVESGVITLDSNNNIEGPCSKFRGVCKYLHMNFSPTKHGVFAECSVATYTEFLKKYYHYSGDPQLTKPETAQNCYPILNVLLKKYNLVV